MIVTSLHDSLWKASIHVMTYWLGQCSPQLMVGIPMAVRQILGYTCKLLTTINIQHYVTLPWTIDDIITYCYSAVHALLACVKANSAPTSIQQWEMYTHAVL